MIINKKQLEMVSSMYTMSSSDKLYEAMRTLCCGEANTASFVDETKDHEVIILCNNGVGYINIPYDHDITSNVRATLYDRDGNIYTDSDSELCSLTYGGDEDIIDDYPLCAAAHRNTFAKIKLDQKLVEKDVILYAKLTIKKHGLQISSVKLT